MSDVREENLGNFAETDGTLPAPETTPDRGTADATTPLSDEEVSTDAGLQDLAGNPESSMTALREAWRQSYPGIAAIVFYSLVINVFKLAVPLYIFQLLDRVVTSRSVETLIMLTVIVVAAVVTSSVAEFVRRQLLIKWGGWVERRLGRRLLMSGLRTSQEGKWRPRELLQDLSTLRKFVSSGSMISWLDVVFVPAFVFVVYLISPLLSLVVMIAMAIILTVGLLNEFLSRGSRSAATKATKERADWISAAERDPELIGSFSIAGNLARQWEQSASRRLQENLSTRMVSLATSDTMRMVESCQRIASYGLGIWLVLQGSLTLGGVIAAALLGRIASGTFRRAMSSWRNLSSAHSAYDRVKRALERDISEDRVTSTRERRLPLILDDISHRYSEQPAFLFRHISLRLDPGEVFSVIGPSGSGKSTMARILSGQISPRAGMVRLGDADITRFPPHELAERLGYLSQHVQLFRGTVRDNIAGLAEGIADEELIAAAELVGIHETIINLPAGYDTQICDGDSLFSAGERKQIALARVIRAWPDLLVLDDPESFLDSSARSALSHVIETCKQKGIIVVVTTQSMDLARLSDKALVFKRSGRATLCRNRKEVLEMRRETKRSKPRIISSTQPAAEEK